MILDLLRPTLLFLQANYLKIIISAVFAVIFYLVFFLTTSSLKKLGTEISPFYPFYLFLPKEGAWSVGYFLLAIIVLGALIYFMLEGHLYAGPA